MESHKAARCLYRLIWARCLLKAALLHLPVVTTFEHRASPAGRAGAYEALGLPLQRQQKRDRRCARSQARAHVSLRAHTCSALFTEAAACMPTPVLAKCLTIWAHPA
jgi:hypothetical protein